MNERNDKERPTPGSGQQDEIPLRWKLAVCAVFLFLVSLVVLLLTVPLSCLLMEWPQPLCRIPSSMTGGVENGK